MEVYKYLEYFPAEARDRLKLVYSEHAAMLKADKFGHLVHKSKCGYM